MSNTVTKIGKTYFEGAMIDEKVTKKKVNEIIDSLNGINTKGTVTQGTSITTGVTLDAPAGVITTVSTTLAAGASAGGVFTLTNSYITTSSVILANCLQGATGSSVNALVSNITNGSCDILLTNVGGTTTGAATITIHFLVI